MERFYLKKSEKVQHVQAIVSDLEIRLSALKGDEIAIGILSKESKEDKMETLQNHITNLNSLHQYVESFFEAWITEQKQLGNVKL